jgi:hypothetical protein
VLVVTSYRLDLPQQLQRIVEADKSSAAQLHAVMGNFIGWLGYEQTPVTDRPASRVRKGQPIFVTPVVNSATPRLTHLGEQPVHAATVYVYDWLVALYSRATENIDYQARMMYPAQRPPGITGYFALAHVSPQSCGLLFTRQAIR